MILIRLMKSSILNESEVLSRAKSNSIPALCLMSKNSSSIRRISAAFVLILQFFTFARSQSTEAEIRIDPTSPSNLSVKGRFSGGEVKRGLRFVREYAGLTGLDERISNVRLTDAQGRNITFRRGVAGELVADADLMSWEYQLNAAPPTSPSASSNVSWVTADGGVIFLSDLLPTVTGPIRKARVKVDLPAGWTVVSTDYPSSMDQQEPDVKNRNILDVTDSGNAVLFVGPKSRQRVVWSGPSRLIFNLPYEPQFNVDEGLSAAVSVWTYYKGIFGSLPFDAGRDYLISMNKFPTPTGFGEWEANTRGHTVTIISSDVPFKSQSLQRLHEQLRHEMFHFWIPNGVSLTGDYDWFYEGFALYQSLKMGVAAKQIRFEDMLETLSRAYEADTALSPRRSLLEESRDRWRSGGSAVYARGILVAFLCDIAMLDASKGRRSTDELLSEIYTRHRLGSEPVDGNWAILREFDRDKSLANISAKYITGSNRVDLSPFLAMAGLDLNVNSGAHIGVSPKPSGRQKDLLNKLGYNSWRKTANQ